ncbi:MAG: hypothetical protein ACYC9O_12865 [Candidatus Latescibacterota bacterium]
MRLKTIYYPLLFVLPLRACFPFGCSTLSYANGEHDIGASGSPLYGCPWNANGLANLEIGKQPGRMISYRFRAENTGMADSVCIYLIFRAAGYFKGNGGQALLELRSDDGSPGHFPSGEALTSSPVVKDPMKQPYRMVPFVPAIKLEKGELYHLVFTNPAPDPANNFVSVDDLLNPTGDVVQRQPGISDTDLAVVWKMSGDSPWEVNPRHTPIYCLYYHHGARQGQGYYNARSQSCLRPVSGEQKVRERFTVSGRSRTVRSLSVRLYKKGNPGDLRVRLEDADGRLVATKIIPAATAKTSPSWVSCDFDSPVTLRSGKCYHLLLSTEPGDPYLIYPLSEGFNSGFRSPNLFRDGCFEFTDGGEWQSNAADDMQFYFRE